MRVVRRVAMGVAMVVAKWVTMGLLPGDTSCMPWCNVEAGRRYPRVFSGVSPGNQSGICWGNFSTRERTYIGDNGNNFSNLQIRNLAGLQSRQWALTPG